MRKLNKLKQELLIMKTNNIKPNYAELARIHNCDYRTVKKYDNGYEGKPTTRNKKSRLDKYKHEIKTGLVIDCVKKNFVLLMIYHSVCQFICLDYDFFISFHNFYPPSF